MCSSVAAMRLGVLDVGSNTVHLLVVDAHPGARPMPASSHKLELQLAQHLLDDGRVGPSGADALVEFVWSCLQVAEDQGVQETVAFATSALREAPNGEEVLARVRAETGADLQVLPGRAEAELTFLAVRRWYGWSARELLVLDIGGGSLEIARGQDELPDVALSLPLGAGRVTRDLLPGDPPDDGTVRAARKFVRAEMARVVREVTRSGRPDVAVATSKTFRSLARVCGAPPSSEGGLRPPGAAPRRPRRCSAAAAAHDRRRARGAAGRLAAPGPPARRRRPGGGRRHGPAGRRGTVAVPVGAA